MMVSRKQSVDFIKEEFRRALKALEVSSARCYDSNVPKSCREFRIGTSSGLQAQFVDLLCIAIFFSTR